VCNGRRVTKLICTRTTSFYVLHLFHCTVLAAAELLRDSTEKFVFFKEVLISLLILSKASELDESFSIDHIKAACWCHSIKTSILSYLSSLAWFSFFLCQLCDGPVTWLRCTAPPVHWQKANCRLTLTRTLIMKQCLPNLMKEQVHESNITTRKEGMNDKIIQTRKTPERIEKKE